MNFRKLLKFLIIGGIITFCLNLINRPIGKAELVEPEVILTWQALSYAPADYRGRVLPTANSPIAASVEVFDRVSGKLIDLSEKEIRWYIGNNLIESPPGRQRLIFKAPSILPKTIKLRVEIPNLGESSFALKAVNIPVAPPEAIIEAPFYNNKFSTSSISLKSNLYFWSELNKTNLNYNWLIGGEAAQKDKEAPDILNIKVGENTNSGYPVIVDLEVSNPNNQDERAFYSLVLTFIKQK